MQSKPAIVLYFTLCFTVFLTGSNYSYAQLISEPIAQSPVDQTAPQSITGASSSQLSANNPTETKTTTEQSSAQMRAIPTEPGLKTMGSEVTESTSKMPIQLEVAPETPATPAASAPPIMPTPAAIVETPEAETKSESVKTTSERPAASGTSVSNALPEQSLNPIINPTVTEIVDQAQKPLPKVPSDIPPRTAPTSTTSDSLETVPSQSSTPIEQTPPTKAVPSTLIAPVVVAPRVNSKPTAKVLVSPPTGRVPLTVTLDAGESSDSDGQIIGFGWDLGDRETKIGKKISHTYTQPGTYRVILSVTDNNGSLGTVSKEIIVKGKNVVPVAEFKVTPSGGKGPLAVSLDASASKDADGNIEAYEWAFSDQTEASGKQLTHVFKEKGKYTIKLTVTDDDGVPVTLSRTVKVPNILPSIKMFATPLAGKAPLQIRTNAYGSKDSDGKIKSFLWSYGDSKLDQGLKTKHVYTEQGTYELKLTVTDNDGGSRTQIKKVVVYPANKLPEATFTVAPQTGKAPLKVRLDASGSTDSDGKIKHYSWSFGDKQKGAGSKLSHTYTKQGSYNLQLSVTDDDGKTISISKKLIVKPRNKSPEAKFSATPTRGKAPHTINVDASESEDSDGVIENYAWSFGDKQGGKGKNLSHVYTKQGTYLLKLKVTDDDGKSRTATRQIVVRPPNKSPRVKLSIKPATGKAPLDIALDASGSNDRDGKIKSFKWSFGDNETGEGAKINHTYTNQGTYTLDLKITDDDGATKKVSKKIIVKPPNVNPTVALTMNPLTGKAPLKVRLDASGSKDSDGAIKSYIWFFGDRTKGKGVKATHTYEQKGQYTVQLTVIDDNGAFKKLTKQIVVKAPNIAPRVGLSATPIKGKAPLEVSLDASGSIDSDGKIDSYNWSFGDKRHGEGEKISHTYTRQGTYTLRLKVTDDDGEPKTATKQIVVRPPNKAPIADLRLSPATGKAPLQVRVDATGSKDLDGKITDYNWSFGDSKKDKGQKLSHIYEKQGSYSLKLTLIDDDGATKTITKQITVKPPNKAPTVSLSAIPIIGKVPLKVRLDASSSSDSDGKIDNFFWSFGDSAQGSGVEVNHTFTKPGTYAVMLTVTDDDGEPKSLIKEIVVKANQPPQARIIANKRTGKAPLTVFLDAQESLDRDGEIIRYEWSFGDGTQGQGAKLNHTFAKQGEYQVALTVFDDDGVANKIFQNVNVKAPNRLPTADFSFGPASGKAPFRVTFNGSRSNDSDGVIGSYGWKFIGGYENKTDTESGVQVERTYTQAGTHRIELIVTDDDGASSTVTKRIKVEAPNRAPLVQLSAKPIVGPAPLKVSLDASGSRDADGQIRSYRWDFGDNTQGTEARLTHTFVEQGAYNVRLTVTDSDGAEKSVNQQVMVEAPKIAKQKTASAKSDIVKLKTTAKPKDTALKDKQAPLKTAMVPDANQTKSKKFEPKPEIQPKISKFEADEDRVMRVRVLIRAGAPKLAESILDEHQPDIKNQEKWMVWEKQRLNILSEQENWEAIVKRVESFPKGLPVQFDEQAHEQLVEAYLQLGKGDVARQLLTRKLKSPSANQTSVGVWRTSLIHSYLREGLIDEARSAMDKVQAEFKPNDKAWKELYARLLVYAGEVTKALAVISDLDTYEARFLELLAHLRGNSLPIEKIIIQSRKLEKEARKRPDIHNDVLQLVAEAARQGAKLRWQVSALERFFANRTLNDYVKLFDFDLEDLWQAYIEVAKEYDRQKNSLGTRESALHIAKELTKGSPLTARAVYAFLVSTATSQPQFASAHHTFAQYLIETKKDRLVFAIYGDKKKFSSTQAIPVKVRYLLSERAIYRGDVKTAAQLVKGLEVGPQGMDQLDWSLRRARLEIYTGNYSEGAKLLQKIVVGREQFDDVSSDKMLQPLFDLQAVGKTRAALDLFKLLYDRVESDKHKREILLWIAEAYESELDLQRAAEYYLRSAVYHSRGYDVWGQSARFRAAEAMAKAGLVEDARRIYLSLLAVSEDAQRKAILERRVQQLWIADAVAKNADAVEKNATPRKLPIAKKSLRKLVSKPAVKIKAKKVKIKSSVVFEDLDEGLLSN